MKAKRLLFLLPALVALLLFSRGSTTTRAAPYVYEVYMYGDNVVPGVDTNVYGFLRFFFNESMTEADVTVDVKGLSDTGNIGADIRAGKPGANGPVIFHLTDGNFIVTSAHIKLTAEDLQHMVNGDWYGIVYSTYNPKGESRGQILLPASAIPGAAAPTATFAPATPTAAPAPTRAPSSNTGGNTTNPGGVTISPPNTGDAGLKAN
ncbi:MAG TPA: CHRD domain-containing protein [Dehalococcoidia bacterium]|nr:CHRD domain-containing protein [Dehalococcoidia bacterium]